MAAPRVCRELTCSNGRIHTDFPLWSSRFHKERFIFQLKVLYTSEEEFGSQLIGTRMRPACFDGRLPHPFMTLSNHKTKEKCLRTKTCKSATVLRHCQDHNDASKTSQCLTCGFGWVWNNKAKAKLKLEQPLCFKQTQYDANIQKNTPNAKRGSIQAINIQQSHPQPRTVL